MARRVKTKAWIEKCAVCRQPFYQPKILPCFHTFCLTCLDAVVRVWDSQEDSGKEKRQETATPAESRPFPCPICQAETFVPDEGVAEFEDNDYLPESDGSNDKGKRSIKVLHCLVCSEQQKVEWVCFNCKKMMCEKCYQCHLQFAAEDHKVERVVPTSNVDERLYDEIGPEKNPPAEPSTVYEIDDQLYQNIAPVSVRMKSSTKDGYIEMTRPLKSDKKSKEETPPVLPPRSIVFPPRLLTSASCPEIARPTAASDKSPQSSDSEEEMYGEYELWSSRESKSPSSVYKLPMSPSMFRAVSADEGQQGDVDPYETVQFSLLPKQLKLKDCRGKINFFCAMSDGNLVLFCTTFKKRREPTFKVKVFGLDGKCQNSTSMDNKFSSAALLEERTKTELKTSLVVADDQKSILLSTALQSIQFSEISHISLDNPVLSKPAPGQPLYVIGTNYYGQHDCQRVLLRRSTPPYSIHYSGKVMAFDVSTNGQYFALLGKDRDVTVEVYRKEGEHMTHVSGYNFDDVNGRGDVSFYIPQRGQIDVGEFLVVADNVKNRLFLLDHVADGRIMGKKRIDSPVCFAKDRKGRLLLSCDSSTEEFMIFEF